MLSYCHNTLNDKSLVELLPYFAEKGVGVISASVTSMGLFTKQASITACRPVLLLRCWSARGTALVCGAAETPGQADADRAAASAATQLLLRCVGARICV